MNWYKIVISANRDDYLRSLGATDDIINFINSKDSRTSQILVNEFRKNPQLTLQQVQQMAMPKNVQPDFSKEIDVLKLRFDDDMVKWILPMFRIKRGTMTYEESSQEYRDWFSQFMSNYSLEGRKISEIKDWKVQNNIQIASYTLPQAIVASDAWHKMMAEKGKNLTYEEKNIVYGPVWEDEKFNGWTIQEVKTENDLEVEGNRMNHCVSSYCKDVQSGESIIYSLRDPNNEPHVTIEVTGDGKGIDQIQGNSNSEPKLIYKKMLKEWFSEPNAPKYIIDNDIDNEWDQALYGYKGKHIDSATEDVEKVLEIYDRGDEYGLKPDGKPSDYLEGIYEAFLNSIYQSNDRGYYRSSNSDKLLSEIAVSGGDKSIQELLNLINITEDGKYDKKTGKVIQRGANDDFMEWIADSELRYPEREDYKTDKDYEIAEREYYDVEAECRKDSVPLGWIDDIYKALNKEMEKKLGINLQQWYNSKKENAVVAKNKNWYKIAQEYKDIYSVKTELDFLSSKKEIVKMLQDNSVQWEEIIFADRTSIITFEEGGLYVIDDYQFPDAEDAQEWVDGLSDDNIDRMINRNFNSWFWNEADGVVLYHGTSMENLDNIKKYGLQIGDKTRGISNKFIGNAIFASENIDTANSYYEVVLGINIGLMAKDSYMPEVSREPDVESYENRMSLANKIGLDNYHYDVEQGMDPGTIIIYGDIPAKYLEVV